MFGSGYFENLAAAPFVLRCDTIRGGMPVARDPSRKEFFVYALDVLEIPFYIGIGRSKRASDRVRYVEYLMRREASGKSVKWCLSTRVIAEFRVRRLAVTVRSLHSAQTRHQALTIERDEIIRLVSSGVVLANRHYNRHYPSSPGEVVQAVLKNWK